LIKKIFLMIIVLSGVINAESVGFEAGIKVMNTGFSSVLQDTNKYLNPNSNRTINNNDLGLDSPNLISYWFLFDHPIPIIPNYKGVISKFRATGAPNQLNWADKSYGYNIKTQIDLSYMDNILYYPLHDSDTSRLNAGLGLRSYSGFVRIDSLTESNYDFQFNSIYPVAYVDGSMWLFGMPILAEFETIAITTSDHKIVDYSIDVKYIHPKTGIGGMLGYRGYSLTLTEVNDLSAEFTTNGLYYGLFWRF